MTTAKQHKVSKRSAKRFFSTIGMVLILYVLFVLLFPFTFVQYLDITNSEILDDNVMYFGICLLIVTFGTLIPFFLLRLFCKIKVRHFSRSVSASFVELFVQTIVLFVGVLILTYVSNIVVSYFGLQGKLICSIGLYFEDSYLKNLIFVFTFVAVTPILEEYAFRGVLLNALGKYGKTFALYASALLFALAHANFSEMLPAFAMGFILNKISFRYKSIVPTILIHILFNAFLFMLCILPGNVTKYIAYVLVGISFLALYLIFSGRYQFIKVQKLKTNKANNILFFTRPTIIVSMALMILSTLLFTVFLN